MSQQLGQRHDPMRVFKFAVEQFKKAKAAGRKEDLPLYGRAVCVAAEENAKCRRTAKEQSKQ